MAETQEKQEAVVTKKSSIKQYIAPVLCAVLGLAVGYVGTDLSNAANKDLVNISQVPTNPTEEQVAYAKAIIANASKIKVDSAKEQAAGKIASAITEKTGIEVSTSNVINLFNQAASYAKGFISKEEAKK